MGLGPTKSAHRADGRDPRSTQAWMNREVRTFVVPVVFLVLPVTVIFAGYPGFAVLSRDLWVRTTHVTSGDPREDVERMSPLRVVRRRWAQVMTAGGDRGDVPGWVMVTLTTAGLVLGLWAVAGDQLENVFTEAMSRVLNF